MTDTFFMMHLSQMKTRPVLRASFFFIVLSLVLTLSACTKSPESFTLSGATMGTTYHITLVQHPDVGAVNLEQLQQLVDQELVNINQLMSTYIADSELSLFNQFPVGQWYEVSPETLAVIEYSLSLSALTSGKFDVTVSPLINLWGFGHKGDTHFPSDEAIAEAKQTVGWGSVIIDKQHSAIKKAKPLSVNLSAVAKGYGVDHIAQVLDAQGIDNYLVEIGGEIRVSGKNQKQLLWRIGVESPSLLQSGAQKVISIDNEAVATSGDYRNFFEKDGIRYSHTIDPVTGKPVIHNIASITVIADTAMEADGLATALMVLGEEKALALATEKGIPVYMLLYEEDNFSVLHSPAFKRFLH